MATLKKGQIVACMTWREPPSITDIAKKFKGKNLVEIAKMLGTQFGDGIIATQRDFLHLPEPAHHTTHLMQITEVTDKIIKFVEQKEKVKTRQMFLPYFVGECQGGSPTYAVFDLSVEPDGRFFEAAEERDRILKGSQKKTFWGKLKSGLYDIGSIVGFLIGAVTGYRPKWFDLSGAEVCSTFVASRTQCGYLAMGLSADTLYPGKPDTADYYPGYVWQLKRVVVV